MLGKKGSSAARSPASNGRSNGTTPIAARSFVDKCASVGRVVVWEEVSGLAALPGAGVICAAEATEDAAMAEECEKQDDDEEPEAEPEEASEEEAEDAEGVAETVAEEEEE